MFIAAVIAALVGGVFIGMVAALAAVWSLRGFFARLDDPTGLVLRLPFGILVYAATTLERGSPPAQPPRLRTIRRKRPATASCRLPKAA